MNYRDRSRCATFKILTSARLFIASSHVCRDKVAYILKNQNTGVRWNDCQDAKKRYTRGPWVHPDARRESMATTLRPRVRPFELSHPHASLHACSCGCARLYRRRSRVLNACIAHIACERARKHPREKPARELSAAGG